MSPRIPDTHAEAWALLPWLANGRIDAVDREWVEAHLQGCAECRAEVAAQRMVATQMNRGATATSATSATDEQRSFNKLWARIEASESAAAPLSATAGGTRGARGSRAVRWLAAAVVVQALGLGVLGMSSLRGASGGDDYKLVAVPAERLNAPAVRLVFDPAASIDTINTLLMHQGLEVVSGPGTAGNYAAVLSADAVASGATAEAVADVLRKDPNVSFAEPVAR
jgi:anti-sigma factor RsiW